jgi:DNA polymerase elongation subunit (family B)
VEVNKLQTLNLEEFNNLDISPYQVYGLDLDYQQSFSINSYLENKNDTIDNDQLLNIVFADIEVFTNNAGVFPKPEQAKFPINAITIYSTFEKVFRSYFLLQHSNINKFPSKDEIPDLINQFTKDLLVDKYINSDEKLEIYVFTSEMDLIKACWEKIREIDPSVLSGYNMDKFDLPYIYFRLSNLLNKNEVEIGKILSLFGKIKVEKFGNEFLIKIPEMPVSDLMYLYKVRDDGGLNMGSKLSSYALDFVADHELNLRKKDYKDEGMSLDTFYEKDPVNFLLYNIIDVCLCVRLNQKLKHIESYNMLRRLMRTSFTSSLRGSSILFDTYVNYKLNSENKFTRFGIVEETAFSISSDEIANLYIPKQMKQTIKEISASTVRAILGRFPGAYVKNSKAQILTNKDGIIIDLDASLPPDEKIFVRRDNKTFWGNIGNYEFKEDDETLTWDKNNNVCWKKILRKIEHDWDGEIVKITTETGKQVTVTCNHSIFGIQQNNLTSIPYLVDAGKLTIGDYIIGCKSFEPDGIKTSHNAELLGFWLSDGWTSSINGSYYIAKQDPETLRVFYPDIDNIRIKRLESDKYKEEWIGTIREPVRTELKDFYISTKRKKFLEILNYPKDLRKLIWKGMFDADGTLHTGGAGLINPTERLCKYRSEECLECFIVAHTIDWLPKLRTIGIDNSQKYGPDFVCKEVFQSRKGYAGILSRNGLSCNHRHPYSRLKILLPYISDTYSETIGLEKIIKIEKLNYQGKVYDISVEETERFFAGSGLGAHNSSLYPSMINQLNISFDTFFGKIIDPITYNFLAHLEPPLKAKIGIPQQIYSNIYEFVVKFVDRLKPQNKGEYVQNYYLILAYLLKKISDSKRTIQQLFNQDAVEDYLILKRYLLPAIDLFDDIHPKSKEYNSFCNEYIINNSLPTDIKQLFIIENILQPSLRVKQILTKDFEEYLRSNNLMLSLSGCLFVKHEVKKGLFIEFLKNLKELRNSYEAEMKKHSKDSVEYSFYNMRQKAVKVTMNTTLIS